MNKFAVIIISHGRAECVHSAQLLANLKYQGDWYIVIDDLDEQGELYKRKYGNRVVVFDKEEYFHKTDSFDNAHKLKACVYVRNFVLDYFADKYEYVFILDDDVRYLRLCYVKGNKIAQAYLVNLHNVLKQMTKYMDDTDIQIVGVKNSGIMNIQTLQRVERTIQQGMLCRTSTNVRFCARYYEDFITSALYGYRGSVFIQLPFIDNISEQIGTNEGGVEYEGSYIAGFMAVMALPSAVTIIPPVKGKDLTIRRRKNNYAPQIINSKYKKL